MNGWQFTIFNRPASNTLNHNNNLVVHQQTKYSWTIINGFKNKHISISNDQIYYENKGITYVKDILNNNCDLLDYITLNGKYDIGAYFLDIMQLKSNKVYIIIEKNTDAHAHSHAYEMYILKHSLKHKTMYIMYVDDKGYFKNTY